MSIVYHLLTNQKLYVRVKKFRASRSVVASQCYNCLQQNHISLICLHRQQTLTSSYRIRGRDLHFRPLLHEHVSISLNTVQRLVHDVLILIGSSEHCLQQHGGGRRGGGCGGGGGRGFE
ncbi:hypothetical protein AVEN_125764-1 [Araneus ventricosus]|uniref:Uncharacterized protein n=1 Tax=Araneus ventricosus TaxID=182803 RepID=A0A4Y2QY25_ARAVE|nr:hypothetical protein AVEN_125764-1 [Araneus ventricosus]